MTGDIEDEEAFWFRLSETAIMAKRVVFNVGSELLASK